MRDAAQRSAEHQDERPARRPSLVARRHRPRAAIDRRRHAHDPAMPVDWVAEEAFVPLVRLDARIRNVVPMAFRRWRDAPFAPQTWREFRGFRRALRREDYSAVLDLQEQVKGAIVTRMARGRTDGSDRRASASRLRRGSTTSTIASPATSISSTSCRALAAAAFGYRVEGPPRWQFAPPDANPIMPASGVCRSCSTRPAAPTSCGPRNVGARCLRTLRARAHVVFCLGEAKRRKNEAGD